MNELDFLQQLLQLQQNGTGFLGSTTQYRSPVTANTVMPAVQSAMTGITGVGSGVGSAVSKAADAAAGVGALSGISKAADAAAGVAGAGADAAADAGAGASALIPALGIGLTAASTVMSFIEAGKAADAQRAADKAAAAALVEQKRLQQQNFYEALKVPMEAYDRQFREGTAANAQAIDALSQDPRMLIGAIQGVQDATIEGQAKSREALADRLYNLDVMKAQASTQQADDLSKIAEQEAAGAQVAAMAAEKAKIAQQGAALQGVGGLITQGAGMYGTYGGLANAGDQLQTLLGGTSFARPSAQPSQAQLLQMLSQNPNLLSQLLGQQKQTTL